MLLFCARRAHSIIPHTVWGTRERGIFSFSKENIPLTPPRERTRGVPLDPPTLRDYSLNDCTRCAVWVRCTWLRHESLRFGTDCNRALLS